MIFNRNRLVVVNAATVILWTTGLVIVAASGFTRDIEGKTIGTDHIAFYSAAKLIDEGRGNFIYDNGFMWDYQPGLLHQTDRFLDAYRNPPFYALLYVPTSRLPYLASFWIWTAVSLAALWFGVSWLGAQNRLTAFLLALSFYPVITLFGFGQNSLLSLASFSLTFRLLDRGKPRLAGFTAGFLLFKPQLLLGLGVWWLLSFRQYGRCLAGLTLAGLAWLGVSLLVVPAETRLFVEKLPDIAAYTDFDFWLLHNPRGFGALITFTNKRIGDRVGLFCLVVALVCFVPFWRLHRGNMPIMFAAAVFLTLWASPHTMIYEWSLALIPAILLWERVPEKRDNWVIIFVVSWIALFVSTFIARALVQWTGGWAIQISVPIMGAVGIWTTRVLRSTSN